MNGDLKRNEELDRIDFLTNVRNKAIEPMIESYINSSMRYETLVFSNDIYFCYNDVLRHILMK